MSTMVNFKYDEEFQIWWRILHNHSSLSDFFFFFLGGGGGGCRG